MLKRRAAAAARRSRHNEEKHVDALVKRRAAAAERNSRQNEEKHVDALVKRRAAAAERKSRQNEEKHVDALVKRRAAAAQRKHAKQGAKVPGKRAAASQKTQKSKRQGKIAKRRQPVLKKRKSTRPDAQQGYSAIQQFLHDVADGPIYVCTSCHKMEYRSSVRSYDKGKLRHPEADSYTTGRLSSDGAEYICKSCWTWLGAGKMPPQCQHNNMAVPPLPEVLSRLNDLEMRLLCTRYPFMKIVSLPTGGQAGIQGSVVNVPVDVHETCANLPRSLRTSGIVAIKLKRALKYKGHVMYKYVHPAAVLSALQWLRENNRLYKDIAVNDNWTEREDAYDEEMWQAVTELSEEEENAQFMTELVDELLEAAFTMCDSESSVMVDHVTADQFDSCIIPAQTAPVPFTVPTATETSTSNNHRQRVHCIAPGANAKPISLLRDDNVEERSFPNIFPTGEFGFSHRRNVQLSLAEYACTRLKGADPRFVTTDYLFWTQNLLEYNRLISSVSIALRKGHSASQSGPAITAGMLKNESAVNALLRTDLGYKFTAAVRGSPAYWQKTRYELLAMINQLGIPTFFLTLSAADLQWPDIIKAVASQFGISVSDEDVINMSFTERCRYVKLNPVTVARHFDYRVRMLFRDVIFSKEKPLGQVTDYFRRIEAQARGSVHAHCLLWVKDAPKLGANTEAEVISFIDKHCTVALPSDDEHLLSLLKRQRHSHTKTCGKNGETSCRFNFPKKPRICTRVGLLDPRQDADNEMAKRQIKEVWEQHPECKPQTQLEIDNLLNSNYSGAVTIFLKRTAEEAYINNYNPIILRAWQANMDIQYVTNINAVVNYILCYVTKPEKDIGELLKSTLKEMPENCTPRERLKRVGNVLMNARELSAQEAAYRAVGLPLRTMSRTVVYVDGNKPHQRTRILKSAADLKKLDSDSTDIFRTGLVERYAARPNCIEDMCLAEFASLYKSAGSGKSTTSVEDNCSQDSEESGIDEPLLQHQVRPKSFELKGKAGIMIKRHRPAVIRTHHFHRKEETEKHCYAMLKLYLPWRDELVDLMDGFQSAELHFTAVADTIKEQIQQYQHFAKDIEECIESMKKNDADAEQQRLAMAGEMFAPQAEQENDNDVEPDPEYFILNPDGIQQVPDIDISGDLPGNHVDIGEFVHENISEQQLQELIKSLNADQRQFYDIVYNHCKELAQDKHPPPLHLFCTGGAGVGKSHVIKTIRHTIQHLLHTDCPDDTVVLVTAPTGTAAHNINGDTIHHALSLPVQKGTFFEYKPLSHEKKQKLANRLCHVKYLIIDEVSMIGYSTLQYVHQRLAEIFDCTDPETYFGGISILLFGDLFQLPPVMAKMIFEDINNISCVGVHLWRDLFRVLELHEIMRQKDDLSFAQLLNRVRLGHQTDADITLLSSRTTYPNVADYPHEALHIFATNKECDRHNSMMMERTKGDSHVYKIVAEDDFTTTEDRRLYPDRDARQKRLEQLTPSDTSSTGGLPKMTELCLGCRIMLRKNINVTDGLVNGAQGTVVGFSMAGDKTHPESCSIRAVFVAFDGKHVGVQTAKKSSYKLPNDDTAVPIERHTSHFFGKNRKTEITRQQFPLVLCWGATIHRVQGLTIDKAVVSLRSVDKRNRARAMQYGQAYVALSRVRSLAGLYILQFDKSSIRASPAVNAEMQRLRAKSDSHAEPAAQASQMTNQQCTSNAASVTIPAVSQTTETSLTSTQQNNTTAWHQVDDSHLVVSRNYNNSNNGNIFAHCATTSPNTNYLQNICSNFNLEFVPHIQSEHSRHDAVACELEALIHSKTDRNVHVEIFRIVGDGNCLFRALSLGITRSQKQHGLLRSYVVNHMMDDSVRGAMEQLFATREQSSSVRVRYIMAMIV